MKNKGKMREGNYYLYKSGRREEFHGRTYRFKVPVYQCTTAEKHTKLSFTDVAPKLEEDRTSLSTLWVLGQSRQSMYTCSAWLQKRGCSTHITDLH